MADLVQQVKTVQRQTGAKQAWEEFCDNDHGGLYDPGQHEESSLKSFLDWWKTEGAVASGGPSPALVQQVKIVTKKPACRQAWEDHCDAELDGFRDPSRHTTEVLQSFLDWWKSEGQANAGPGGGGASEKLVEKVKWMQKKAGARKAWEEYCDELGGVRDPAQHTNETLNSYLNLWAAQKEKAGVGGRGPSTEMIQQLKQAKSNPEFKKAWHAHCDTELGGVRDPCQLAPEAVQSFLEWWKSEGGDIGPVVTAAKTNGKSGGGGKGGGGGGQRPPAALSDKVKALQRGNAEMKATWEAYCDEHGGGFYDPGRCAAQLLKDFISLHGDGELPDERDELAPQYSAPTSAKGTARGGKGAAGAAAGAAPATASTGSKARDFIKNGAGVSPKFKQQWSSYCKVKQQGFSDPTRLEESFVQGFIDYIADVVEADLAAGGAGAAGGGEKRPAPAPVAAEAAAAAPAAKKKITIRKSVADEIARLNAHKGYAKPIRLGAVAPYLCEFEEGTALEILAQMEMEEDVEDPNEKICSLCRAS